MKKKPLTDKQKRAIHLMAKGMNQSAVAKKIGVAQQTVWRLAQRDDVKELLALESDEGTSDQKRLERAQADIEIVKNSAPRLREKATAQLIRSLGKAIKVLVDLLDSDNEGRRMDAAKIIMQHANPVARDGGKRGPSVQVVVNSAQISTLSRGLAEMQKDIELHQVEANWEPVGA